MPVYADVLFVLNGFVNYLMLLSNMKILKLNTTRLRLLIGSSIGSVISLKIFLPEASQTVEFIIRFFSVLIIVFFSYKFTSLKEFLKGAFGFLGISFIFSGLMICIILFINPPQLLYDNGVIYYEIDFLNVVIISCTAFFFITLAEKILKKKADRHYICYTEIYLNEKSVKGRGFIDTGNTLKDPFSNQCVIVADYKAVFEILPESLKAYLNKDNINLPNLENIRLIPITTLSGTGVLPAFKADKIKIRNTDKSFEKIGVLIAVSQQKLCNGEFEFILNNSITEADENAKNQKTYC